MTIPAELRRKYGIAVGSVVLIEDTGEGLLVTPVPGPLEEAGADAGRYSVGELKKGLDGMRLSWR